MGTFAIHKEQNIVQYHAKSCVNGATFGFECVFFRENAPL